MRSQNERKSKSGSLAQVVEHLTFNQVVRGSSPRWLTNQLGLFKVLVQISGPVVKRLRHRPFTAETWVRFPSGSPQNATLAQLVEQLTCGIDKT